MLNNCTLIGRLVRDVEIKGSSVQVAKYTIAVKRKFAKQGTQDIDFINVTSFGKAAEFVEKYFKKGDCIGVTGEIHIDKVDDKYYTNFVADGQFFVGGKSESTQEQPFNNAVEEDLEDLPF